MLVSAPLSAGTNELRGKLTAVVVLSSVNNSIAVLLKFWFNTLGLYDYCKGIVTKILPTLEKIKIRMINIIVRIKYGIEYQDVFFFNYD